MNESRQATCIFVECRIGAVIEKPKHACYNQVENQHDSVTDSMKQRRYVQAMLIFVECQIGAWIEKPKDPCLWLSHVQN